MWKRLGRNLLIVKTSLLHHYLLEATGVPTTSSAGHSTSDFIPAKELQVYTLSYQGGASGDYRFVCYDSNKQYISGVMKNFSGNVLWKNTTPKGTCYIRVSCPILARTKLEMGKNATDFTPSPEDMLYYNIKNMEEYQIFLKEFSVNYIGDGSEE